MSRAQREALDAQLREAPLDLGGEVAEQRVVIEQMMASTPLADDVTTSDATLGGIPARSIPWWLREGLLVHVDRLTRPHEPMSKSVPTSRSEHPLEQLAMLAGRDQIVWISNRRVRTLALGLMRRSADRGSLPVGVGPTTGDGES